MKREGRSHIRPLYPDWHTAEMGALMTIDIETRYDNFSPPPNTENRIRRRLDKIAENHPDIVACKLVGDETHGHQLMGKVYRIAIGVVLSNGETIAEHDHLDHPSEDFSTALDYSFEALERALNRHSKRRTTAA